MMKYGLILGICLFSLTVYSQGSTNGKKFIPFIGSIHHYEVLDRFKTTETIYIDSLNLDSQTSSDAYRDEFYRIGLEAGFEYLFGSHFSLGFYVQESHGWYLGLWDSRVPFYISTGLDVNFYPVKRLQITPRVGFSSSLNGNVKGGFSYGGVVGYQLNKISHPTPVLLRFGFSYLQRSEHEEGVPTYWEAEKTIKNRITDRLGKRYLYEVAIILKFKGNRQKQ